MCLMTAFVAQSMVARVVTVENVKYDIDESGKTAVLTNGRNVNRDYFSIPSSIWYGNITYEVTGIGDEGVEADAYLGIGLKSLEQTFLFIGLKYLVQYVDKFL